MYRSTDGGDGNGKTDEGDDSSKKDEGEGDGAGSSEGDNEKRFTQADLDRVASQRAAREKKRYEAELEKERQRSSLGEVERLKAENADLKKDLEDSHKQGRTLGTQTRLADALRIAGVKPERIQAALRLIEMDEIEYTDTGEPKEASLKALAKGFVDTYKEFVDSGEPKPPKGGEDFSKKDKTSAPALTMELIEDMSTAELKARYEEVQEFLRKNDIK